MKELFALVTIALCMSSSSFGADVVGHSVKTARRDTYKAEQESSCEVPFLTRLEIPILF